MKSLPDLGKAATLLKISVELEAVDENTLIGYAIKAGIKKNLIETVRMIQDCIKDNRYLMQTVLGNSLLLTIEKY